MPRRVRDPTPSEAELQAAKVVVRELTKVVKQERLERRALERIGRAIRHAVAEVGRHRPPPGSPRGASTPSFLNPDARERRWGEGAAKVTARYVAGAGFLRKVADLPVCESPAGASRSRLARGLPRCGRQAGGRADVTPNFFQTGKCVSFLATDRKKVQILTASQAFSDVFAQIPVGQFTCATHARLVSRQKG